MSMLRLRSATTALASALFAHGASAGTLTSLWNFSSQERLGQDPYAGVIYENGRLYATTYYGGRNGYGLLFELNLRTGLLRPLYSFRNGYGSNPETGLLFKDGSLLGVTPATADGQDDGTVYRFNPQKKHFDYLYRFHSNPSDPYSPNAAVIAQNGLLYGTTTFGGTSGVGALYTLNPSTKTATVLYNFAGGADGAEPEGVLYQSGTFYGVTHSGGLANCAGGNSCGTVYAVDATSGAERILYKFNGGTDAANPISSASYVNGTLYGAAYGGTTGNGAIYAVNATTGAESVTYSFQGNADGSAPSGALLKQADALYGVTRAGGQFGHGTIFSVNLKTRAEQVLYSFSGGKDGGQPTGALIYRDGAFYGTTRCNYTYCEFGSVYEFTP